MAAAAVKEITLGSDSSLSDQLEFILLDAVHQWESTNRSSYKRYEQQMIQQLDDPIKHIAKKIVSHCLSHARGSGIALVDVPISHLVLWCGMPRKRSAGQDSTEANDLQLTMTDVHLFSRVWDRYKRICQSDPDMALFFARHRHADRNFVDTYFQSINLGNMFSNLEWSTFLSISDHRDSMALDGIASQLTWELRSVSHQMSDIDFSDHWPNVDSSNQSGDLLHPNKRRKVGHDSQPVNSVTIASVNTTSVWLSA